jgi:hypothetical protein
MVNKSKVRDAPVRQSHFKNFDRGIMYSSCGDGQIGSQGGREHVPGQQTLRFSLVRHFKPETGGGSVR